jgi:adenylate kinase family enzyme
VTRIHITGASGAGVTSLGAALAAALAASHLDTDDFFWAPSDPPFETKRPASERLGLLHAAFANAADRWVLSGSLHGWGDPLIPLFDRVIALFVPTEIRLARIAARERARFGPAIAPGGALHAKHLDFLAWAGRYDDADFQGRSRREHEAWLAALPCPVLRLDGACATEFLVADIIGRMRGTGHA